LADFGFPPARESRVFTKPSELGNENNSTAGKYQEKKEGVSPIIA
jgi:hypothetical protein